MYYNYIYLDPRKKGNFCYNGLDICFLYEPFYVGKGKNNRFRDHLYENKTTLKNNKIKKIKNEGYSLYNFIIIFNNNKDEQFVLNKEASIIKNIGTELKIKGIKKGPLTNMRIDGPDSSHITEEYRKKISNSVKKFREKLSDKEKQIISQNIKKTWTKEKREYWSNKNRTECTDQKRKLISESWTKERREKNKIRNKEYWTKEKRKEQSSRWTNQRRKEASIRRRNKNIEEWTKEKKEEFSQNQLGSNNPFAKKINIYNNFGELVESHNGTFYKSFKERAYPLDSFKKALRYGTKVYENTDIKRVSEKNRIFKDWTIEYA